MNDFGNDALVGVLDLGIGNVESVVNALLLENILAEAVEPVNFDGYKVIILPGVGHWSRMQSAVMETNLGAHLTNHLTRGGGLVGICLGMQILGKKSSEGPGNGLSLMDFSVSQIGNAKSGPSIGWAEVAETYQSTGAAFDSGPYYFMHDYGLVYEGQDFVKSFYLHASGLKIAAEIQAEKVIGFQFHPERSLSQGRAKLAESIRGLA